MTSKVIIVTGIGAAVAHHLAHHHHLVLIARTHDALARVAATFPADRVRIVAGDLSDPSVAQKAVDVAIAAWKRVDGLVVNHGVLDPIKRVGEAEVGEWRAAFEVNFFSAVGMIQAALPALRESGGNIVITSSGAAVGAYSTWGAYGASKAALNHLAMTLAVEEPSITTVSIRPGVVDTEMQREIREVHQTIMDKKDADKFAALKMEGGLLPPEKPGHVIAKLALGAPKTLSGGFMSWNDTALAEFQD
ncbi:short-chain dehydrogenase/reductase [Eremomyces bilateralis CBS 781.70]|uniref:Short-chain dehydrogenase/reductase n=1 Tax=Eremomyces bilateralis CBS 781.70 TaxID=1392243 RepID=A0A6G1G9S2_9PEZI|nr:short-chain dehydrogenase/reductase [Eremomyces bilateralis CBS 781.70]KAF1814774.1 short-chain dehydrogenase/reductase [Eremomyces bilateralis CBS 781.70]